MTTSHLKKGVELAPETPHISGTPQTMENVQHNSDRMSFCCFHFLLYQGREVKPPPNMYSGFFTPRITWECNKERN
jgi:hypothetical protein